VADDGAAGLAANLTRAMSTPPPSETEQEPGERFRPRHTTAQRIVLAVNIVVVIACFAGAAGLVFAKEVRESFLATDRVVVSTTSPTGPTTSAATGPTVSTQPGDTVPVETFPPADPKALNFLITGADNNACIDPNSPWASAADPARDQIGNRSDTIMVMRVDPVSRAAAVLSFPRDLWVKIPGRGKNRINSAYVKNEYGLLAQTLYDNFGIVIDHYIQLDFCAFKTIVEAVGGVSVPFETPIRDTHINLNIPTAGCHAFGGDEALAYVRSRYLEYQDANGKWRQDPFSDLGRISRQQDFLRRVLKAALDKGVFNPSVARGLIETAQKYVVFDQGFSIDDMLKFVGVLRDVDPGSIPTYQIEVSRLITGGQDVLEPRIKGENMQAILRIFRGEAALVGAPDQVFDNTTTTAVPRTTVPGASTTTTVRPTTTTTIVTGPPATDPADIVKGIVPPRDVQC
jgi:LCP family protein required for cell wall assembly